MSSEFGFCWLLYVDGCQDVYSGRLDVFSTRLTLMGPLFCIYLVPCSVNLWVPCCGIVMSRKGDQPGCGCIALSLVLLGAEKMMNCV